MGDAEVLNPVAWFRDRGIWQGGPEQEKVVLKGSI